MPIDAPPLVLASASPRRKDLLTEAGFTFEVRPSHADEPDPVGFPSPASYVAHVAWIKARGSVVPGDPRWIIAADTMVVLNDRLIGKADDRAHAERILRSLQNTTHHVVTGVSLHLPALGLTLSTEEFSSVHMRSLTDHEIESYLDSRQWEGKAGAYGVQDRDPFVKAIDGSVSNVVGLPMERLAELLKAAAKL
ncbi:MAG: Maf family protein [Planctomycetia bacterium]